MQKDHQTTSSGEASKVSEARFPATVTAHWPSGPVPACEGHARALVKLGRFLGAHVAVTVLDDPAAECANCRNEAAAIASTGSPT